MNEQEKINKLIITIKEFNSLKRKTKEWMHNEGIEGRLRNYSDCPWWSTYIKTETEL